MNQNQKQQAMFIGAVKWFDNQKGFGILALPEEETLFLHIRGFSSMPLAVDGGDVIIGEKRPDRKKEGYVGHNCHLATDMKDWGSVMSLLSLPNKVGLNLSNSTHQKKAHKKRGDQDHSLLYLGARQILQEKTEEEIYSFTTQYFQYTLVPAFFLEYAQLIEKVIQDLLENDLAKQLLGRIYTFFGEQLNHEILFRVWKSGHFNYIGYNGNGDFEIPEEILYLYATEIGREELDRIRAYSFGATFCSEMVEAHLDGLDLNDAHEVQIARSYVAILEGAEKERWENYIESALSK